MLIYAKILIYNIRTLIYIGMLIYKKVNTKTNI